MATGSERWESWNAEASMRKSNRTAASSRKSTRSTTTTRSTSSYEDLVPW